MKNQIKEVKKTAEEMKTERNSRMVDYILDEFIKRLEEKWKKQNLN